MAKPQPCCQDPATLSNVESPFTKILALGFYDGPTSGILECETCSSVYRFDMLDWDKDHEVRIFGLAKLPPNSLARGVEALLGAGSPHWPVWVPTWATSASGQARAAADREIQRVLEQAQPAELVVAWSGYGDRILAARRVPAEQLSGVPDWFSLEEPAGGRDWFGLLGLGKRAAETEKSIS